LKARVEIGIFKISDAAGELTVDTRNAAKLNIQSVTWLEDLSHKFLKLFRFKVSAVMSYHRDNT
jgi:hypothetical protein